MKRIQGFESIDRALKKGRCLTAMQQVLVDARALCPELCRAFTCEDAQQNVAELMHTTSYKIRPGHFSERNRPGQPTTAKGFNLMLTHANGDVLDDFRMYLSGRLWQNGGMGVEVLGMVDIDGNEVDEKVVVAVDDSAPRKPDEPQRRSTWNEDLDPTYVPEHLRVYETPMDRELLKELNEQIMEFEDSRRGDSSASKPADWGKW